MTDRTGLLGGTFDPIHLGHLAAGRAAAAALGLGRVLVVPSSRPPHRPDSPAASGYHRFAMAAMAVAPEPGFEASDLELQRPGPSYTFDTLSRLHAAGHTASRLFFITGADAFAEIATWSRYPAVLDLAHFVVVARPGTALTALRNRLPDLAPRMMSPGAIQPDAPPAVILLEAPTPDVSSTDIRHRAAAGGSLDGYVPPAVASHIARHGLYRGAPPHRPDHTGA
ncbi:MAG: nicotinate-nucleotide adenylyltransferase [Vicinamibacterales bacterium]